MAKVSPLQDNFGSGEFSPLLYGRVTAERYKAALAKCLNYFPTIQGGLTRRPGTYFVAAVKDSTKSTRLIPFEFSTTQAYMLEFGNLYIRFYRNNGLITEAAKTITAATAANPVVITSAAHGFSNGDEVQIDSVVGMTQLNGRRFTVAGVTANTFQLSGIDGSAYTAYSSGGTASRIYTLTSTYAAADLFGLKFTQSADTLYITHPTYPPRKLTRTSHTSWTITTVTFLDGPYLSTNTTTTTLTPSAATGAGVTLTASAITGINGDTGFQTTDVGRLIRIKEGTVWGYATITARTSTTVVTVTVTNTFTNTSAKLLWRLGVYSDYTGYPACITFHEDRLCFGAPTVSPQRIDCSRSGDYENFAPTDTDGTITASHALSFSFNANDVNVIRWLGSGEKGMPAGTVGGEWVVRPSAQGEALSPTNISAKRATTFGSANIAPVHVGKAVLFVQRAGRKLRELTFAYDVDGFRAPDVTLLSEHITQTGVIQLAHQKEPQPMIWCARTDGVLAACTYERDSEDLRAGWHRHILGGTSDAAGSDAVVESVAVIPSADGTRDETWVIVKRYINGATVRYVEYLTKIFDDEDVQRDAFFVDCGLTYDNPLTITGITKANPAVATSAAHGLSNGDVVRFYDVAGFKNGTVSAVNGSSFTVAGVTANTFQLSGIDSSAYTAYISGGSARKLVSTVSGLLHLEGESVSVLADGAVQPNKTVTSGAITLSSNAAVVQVGYGYNSDGQLLRLEAGARDGTSLGKTRRTNRVGFLLNRSLGLKIGTGFDNLTTLTFRTSSDGMSMAPALFSGIVSETLDADYDFENQVCWRQDQPLPSMILAVFPQLVTQDR